MFRRRFLNIVLQNCSDGVCSLRRINLSKNLFYESTEKAREAAGNEKRKTFDKTLRRLPGAVTSFDPSPTGVLSSGLEWFELFCSEDRIVNSTRAGGMAMFDADKNIFLTMPSLSHPKGFDPLTVSITHPGAEQDSLYIMDMYPGQGVNRPWFPPAHAQPRSCFEVLEYVPMSRDGSHDNKGWRTRLLPPPPFVDLPGYEPSLITSYTTLDTVDGSSSICVSSANNGTYCFDTARLDDSHQLGWTTLEEWRHVGEWAMPFDGRAEHVPEFNMWLGFEAPKPYHMCAVDLSALDHGRPPTVQCHWEDLSLVMPEDVDCYWSPLRLRLVNLGDGRFCIAKVYCDHEEGLQFVVLTGIEILRDKQDQSLHIVKHRCTRYMSRTNTVRWVL